MTAAVILAADARLRRQFARSALSGTRWTRIPPIRFASLRILDPGSPPRTAAREYCGIRRAPELARRHSQAEFASALSFRLSRVPFRRLETWLRRFDGEYGIKT